MKTTNSNDTYLSVATSDESTTLTVIDGSLASAVEEEEENRPTDDFFSSRSDIIAVFDHDYDRMKLRNFRLQTKVFSGLDFVILLICLPFFPISLLLSSMLRSILRLVNDRTSFGSTLEKVLCIQPPPVLHTALTHSGIRIVHESATALDTDYALRIPYKEVEAINNTANSGCAVTAIGCAQPLVTYIVSGIPSNTALWQTSKTFNLTGLKQPFIFKRSILRIKEASHMEEDQMSHNNAETPVATEICLL